MRCTTGSGALLVFVVFANLTIVRMGVGEGKCLAGSRMGWDVVGSGERADVAYAITVWWVTEWCGGTGVEVGCRNRANRLWAGDGWRRGGFRS